MFTEHLYYNGDFKRGGSGERKDGAMAKFTKADFVMDSLPGAVFTGYTDGDEWNGWACPYFERAQAEQVLRASEANGFRWRYESERDAYVVDSDRSDTSEVFVGTDIQVNGNSIRVYPVGAYSWIWELINLE